MTELRSTMGPLLGVKGLQTPVTGTSNNPKATPPSSEGNEGVCSLALVKKPNRATVSLTPYQPPCSAIDRHLLLSTA